MDYPIISFGNGRFQVELLVMPRGEHSVELLEPRQSVSYVLVRGRLSIKGHSAGSRLLVATPRAPIILVNSGQYHVVAETSCLGFRGVRLP